MATIKQRWQALTPGKRRLFVLLAFLLLLAILIYFFTYFFAKKNNKVIYEKDGRRIYLIERRAYGNKGREMWRMVLENRKTGKRMFILGNSRKGYPENKMARIVINTIDQGQVKSFDNVESAGVTMRDAKTDIHSNTIEKKGPGDIFKDLKFDTSPFLQL